MAEAKSFDQLKPPVGVTNPHAMQDGGGYHHVEYPRHMHKWGVPPCVVHNDTEKANAVAEGYALQPVLEPPTAVDSPEDPEDLPTKRRPGRPPSVKE